MSATPMTVRIALFRAREELARAGIGGAGLEARLLVQHALGVPAEVVIGHPDLVMPATAAEKFVSALDRRRAREPLSRVLGRREFWSLDFRVTPETLDPRPETETLVEAVLETLGSRDAAPRILDLGTGTGCILLALVSELPQASGIGVDIAPGAAAVARRNAEALGVADRAAFVAGSWADALSGRFDVIVSNPPYIASAEIASLMPEVARYEPLRALDGGVDGLDAYRALGPVIAGGLESNGFAALEIGAGQAAAAAEILRQSDLDIWAIREDLERRERCLIVRIAGGLTTR